jgi:Ca2+-binding RTX toxin-like protein
VLLGAVCAALLAIPGAASAAIVGHYAVDPDTNILELSLTSDDAGDAIVLGRSPNGNVTLNGSVLGFGGMGPIPCNGPEGIEVFGNGGDDTISFAGVSKATGFTSILGFSEDGVRHDEVLAEGGAGHDTMTGGPFAERFNALFAFEFGVGADTVNAGDGDDEIKGTDEGDKLFGGAGKDRFDPGPGDDEAHGGSGVDFFDEIRFYRDADRFFGDGGRDDMYAGGGNDFLDGGAGHDFLDGMKGKDKIFGRAGNDYLRGGPGKDKLNGGPGRNVLDK